MATTELIEAERANLAATATAYRDAVGRGDVARIQELASVLEDLRRSVERLED